MTCIIRHVSHPYAPELYQAHRDHAILIGQPLIERPWWYEDTQYQYHDIYACLGWPTEVTEADPGRPGYAAIVGILRPPRLTKDQHYDPKNADFLLLAEYEHEDVETLLNQCLEMRAKYGYGIQPTLLRFWYGDPDRFLTTLALYNERLGPDKAIMIMPPEDFYVPKIFDNYVRSLRSVAQYNVRFYFGHLPLLEQRINRFYRDDPAIMAVGGLIHTLLGACLWMDRAKEDTVFRLKDRR